MDRTSMPRRCFHPLAWRVPPCLRFLCLAFCAALAQAVPSLAADAAYRLAVTSSPQADAWERNDGFSVTLQMDEARCKKAYGDAWFRRCSAAPAGEEGRLVQGVRLSPAVPGQWRWISADTMTFTPKERLSPATRYTVDLSGVALPSRFEGNRTLTYTTLPQAVSVGKETFWIDPSPKGAHAVSVPLRFIWPAAKGALDSRISLVPADAKSGLAFGPARLIWNERRDEVVVTAPVTQLARDNAAARLTVKGIPAFAAKNGKCVLAPAPAKGAPRDTTSLFSITGLSRLMDVKNITISAVLDEKLNPAYEMTVVTTLRARPDEVLKRLTLVLLPRALGEHAGKPADWTKVPAISAEDIQKGTKLTATALQPLDEPTDRLRLRVPLEAGRGLLAAVDEGLPSLAGPVSGRVRRFILAVPQAGAKVDFLQPGHVLALHGQKKLALHATNVKSVRWRAERVRDPFLALAARHSSFDDTDTPLEVMGVATEGTLAVNAPSGGAAFPVLDLAPLLAAGEDAHGLMRLTLMGLDAKGEEICRARRLILVTDLGMVVKAAADGSRAVFVRSLSSGKPAGGAEVRLLGANGLPVSTASTDAQGRADLPAAANRKDERRPVAVVAAADGGRDLAWLSLDDGARQVDYSDFDVSGRHVADDGLLASVFSQRGLYLPGETLHFGCVVRRGDWQPLPQDLPLEAVLVNPAGREVFRRAFTAGADGLAAFDWNCPDDAPSGAYQMDIRLPDSRLGAGAPVLGSARVRVEEFQPDTLALKSVFGPAAPRGWIRTGAGAPAISALAQLDNLYGEPAANHRVKAVLHTEKARLAFPGFADYTFLEAPGLDGEGQSLDLPDAWTDAAGKAAFALPLASLKTGTWRGAVLLEGFEPAGGRAVSRRLSALFSPLEVAVGYKPEGQANNLDYIPQKAKASLRLLAVNNNLDPVALPDAEAVFSARRYVNSLVTDPRGAYRYESLPVDTELSRTALNLTAGGASVTLPTADAGDFLLTLRRKDGTLLASIPYTVAGVSVARPAGLDSGALAKGDLRLTLDKAAYAPGDTVRLRLSAPYAGTGLITVERDHVAAHAWFTVSQPGESVQEIRIPQDFQGRGYVSVSFARGQDSDEIYMAPHVVAAAPFMAGLDARDMGLKLEAPARVLPGETIVAKATSGTPGRALVFAVDEGVLQLTDFATPAPLRELLGDRALDVETRTAFDLLMPDYARLQGRIPGFGGGMAGPGGRFLNPFKRRGEPPVAFWQGVTEVGPGGTEIRIPVPAYASGKIRLMAVGSAAPQGAPSKAGSAQAMTEVRGTLLLKPLLPLAVAPGDAFDAALAVANTVEGSGKDAKVRVSMEAENGLAFVDKPAPQTIAVAENGEAVLHFRLRAEDMPGEAALRFTATLETPGAKASQRRQTVSVRPPAPRRTTESVMAVRGPASLDVGRDIYPFEAKGGAMVSTANVLALRAVFAKLDAYPYGCTEQLVSRALPYAALLGQPGMRQVVLTSAKATPEDLAKRGNRTINAALAAIGAAFEAGEGVSLWPGGQAEDWLTAYAADFLMTLRENGAATPGALADNVLDTLEGIVGRTPSGINDARVKLYGAWVLQRDGRIMTQMLERLEQWFKDRTRGWETDVAAAFLADGRRMLRLSRQATKLMPDSVNPNTDPFFSTGSARALYGLIVQRAFPDKKPHIPLQDMLDGALSTSATTMEMGLTARTLLALGTDAAPSLDQVTLSCAQRAKGFSADPARAVLQGPALVMEAPGCLRYNVEAPAGGPALQLLARTDAFDRSLPAPGGNRLELERRYLNAKGEPVTMAHLGDVLTIELAVRPQGAIRNVVLVDLLPGGLEPVLEKDGPAPQEGLVRQERREDRAVFFTDLEGGRQIFTYKARAATRGRFTLPAATAEAMYDPAVNAHTGGGVMTVD